jgi:hypothetical protein
MYFHPLQTAEEFHSESVTGEAIQNHVAHQPTHYPAE